MEGRNKQTPTRSVKQKGLRKGKDKTQGKEKLKIGSWNMAIAATQPHAANVNLTSQILEDESLDVLGICECNIFPSTHLERLKIKGYSLEIGEGVNRPTDGNARVAMYISENVQYTRRRDLEERSSMPQVWVEMNLPGTRKLVLGTVYRQFKE